MTMTLDDLRLQEADMKAARKAAYAELVAEIADGNPCPTDSLVISRELGKSVDDLQADVAMLKKRRRWRSTVDGTNNVELDRGGVQAEINQIERIYLSAQQAYQAGMTAARAKLENIAARLREVSDAKNQLHRTAPRELVQRHTELFVERELLASVMDKAKRAVADETVKLNFAKELRAKAEANRDARGIELADLDTIALSGNIAALETSIAEAQRACAAAVEETNRIRLAMLEP